MFYSHEILSSGQYGVATIWIVATVGTNAKTRKVNRKAILDVNVPKACETIVQPPGAPIALRLQGNLLYGVSRVYDQQCVYMLTDVEKVRHQLRTFANAGGTWNALDPNAGQAKREQLLLSDDPNFELSLQLPELHFDAEGDFFTAPSQSQLTGKTMSQLSPMDSVISSSGRDSLLGGFDLSHSSLAGSVHLPSPFGHGSMSLAKTQNDIIPLIEEDNFMPFNDIGLEVDADGNIVQVTQEPELPLLPLPSHAVQGEQAHASADGSRQRQSLVDYDGDMIMKLGQEILPDAAPFSPRHRAVEAPEDPFHVQSPPRRRRGRMVIAEDDATHISRDEFQSWSTNYLRNMAAAHKPTLATAANKAKQNADQLLFGIGLADVGLPTGIPGVSHPLAEFFAGQVLRRHILGPEPTDDQEHDQRGRRRSSSEAFGDEAEFRRTRPRFEDDGQELGRMGDDNAPLPGDDLPEIGREPGSALSDRMSLAPWNRPLSATRGSSVRSKTGPPSLLQGRQASSPLAGRGSILPDIVRLSDNAAAYSESDGFQPLREPSFPSSDHRPFQDISGIEASHAVREALDREGRNFLSFVGGVAAEHGVARDDDDEADGRRWVEFNDLFEAADSTKATAAQAFFHVLTLVTRGAMKVEQDGDGKEPFGDIRLGVKFVPAVTDLEQHNMDDGQQPQSHGADDEVAATGPHPHQHRESDDMSDIYDA